jgi:hypothetical protein
MNIQGQRRRFAAWLACFAVLLAALAPSISHAVGALKGQAAWVEVCTATGTALVKLPGEQVPDQPRPDLHAEHCVFCGNHAGAFALPAGDISLVVAVAQGGDLLPTLYYQAPRPLFVWAAGQPRAPPALS